MNRLRSKRVHGFGASVRKREQWMVTRVKLRFGVFIATVALIASTPLPVFAQTTPAGPEETYIVRFVPATNAHVASSNLSRRGIKVTYGVANVFPGAITKLTKAQADALRTEVGVASVEKDAPVKISATQTSPPWGLDRIDQRALPLSNSYAYAASGSGVTAYIVDTGILGTHADFGGRVRSGYSVITDGKGTTDCHGHGTHVAGTVGGATYGIAKSVSLVAVRVLDCTGSGSISGVIAGLDWAVQDHAAGVPAVVNLSLGGGVSASLDAAVQTAVDDGITAVVAAGNSNVDACTSSPARAPAAITVGATSSVDARASFSNFGTCVDVFAPGVGITSSWFTSPSSTASLSGTSMASPHVAGAAAVLLGQRPTLTPADVANRIVTSATTGVVTDSGSGSPNRLLFNDPAGETKAPPTPTTTTTKPPATTTTTAPRTTTTTNKPATTTTTKPPATTTTTAPRVRIPDPPKNVQAVAWQNAAVLLWQRGDDGGAPLIRQTMVIYDGKKVIGSLPIPGQYTAVMIGGLTPGKSYSFAVSATNRAGTSPLSAPSNALTIVSSTKKS
ncbi:MAG: S8 family serine peptidase [Acidimicrobiia bacterium]